MITEATNIVRQLAQTHGFAQVGISRAEFMEPEARRLEQWLQAGHHGEMQYLENHFDKRVDPTLLVPGAKTVVSLAYNYHTDRSQVVDAPKLASYAYGEDYHFVIKRKLKSLIKELEAAVGRPVNGRIFVDSAPVLERDWARRSGVGWIGKNTLLIHPRLGSYYFLAEMIIDLPMIPDAPMSDYCGRCTRCIDACPTEAIASEGYKMDGSKCISYFTIELRDALPQEYVGEFENWMFGCDICQQVCPWNKFASPHQEPAFEPLPELLKMTATDWEQLTKEAFQQLFKKSAVKRTGYHGLMRNIAFLQQASDSEQSTGSKEPSQ